IRDHVFPGPAAGIPRERVEPGSDRIVEFEANCVVLARADSWDGFRSHAESVEQVQNVFSCLLVMSDQIEGFVVGVSSLGDSYGGEARSEERRVGKEWRSRWRPALSMRRIRQA